MPAQRTPTQGSPSRLLPIHKRGGYPHPGGLRLLFRQSQRRPYARTCLGTPGTRCRHASRNRIQGDKLFFYTAKIGTPVCCPLPPFVIDALNAIPEKKTAFSIQGIRPSEVHGGYTRSEVRVRTVSVIRSIRSWNDLAAGFDPARKTHEASTSAGFQRTYCMIRQRKLAAQPLNM